MHSSIRLLQRGLTLAEVGMALFAIGISVLSIATVYLQREHTASITAQQTFAQSLAAEMTAQIAAHPNSDIRFENAIGVRCAQTATKASPQTEATNVVACWQERVASQLPSGSGSIMLDNSTVPPTYAVTVSWLQLRGGLVSYTVRTTAYAANSASSPRAPK